MNKRDVKQKCGRAGEQEAAEGRSPLFYIYFFLNFIAGMFCAFRVQVRLQKKRNRKSNDNFCRKQKLCKNCTKLRVTNDYFPCDFFLFVFFYFWRGKKPEIWSTLFCQRKYHKGQLLRAIDFISWQGII